MYYPYRNKRRFIWSKEVNYKKSVNVSDIPKTLLNIQGQNVKCVIQNFKFARDLNLVDNRSGELGINSFTKAEVYWQYIMRETKRYSNICDLVATKLR